jgi:hypothetical protein
MWDRMGWDGKKYVKGGGVFVYVYEREAQMGFSFLSFIYFIRALLVMLYR